MLFKWIDNVLMLVSQILSSIIYHVDIFKSSRIAIENFTPRLGILLTPEPWKFLLFFEITC